MTGVVVGPEEVRATPWSVGRFPEPIPALAERVREKAAPGALGRTTTVVVEDVEVVRDENL